VNGQAWHRLVVAELRKLDYTIPLYDWPFYQSEVRRIVAGWRTV
jgi:hypothetical protein